MTEEEIAELNQRLEGLSLCGEMAELPPEDADVLKKTQAKLEEAKQAKKDIDSLIRRHDQLTAEEDDLVAKLELRHRLAELQKAYLDALPPSTTKSTCNEAPTDLDKAGKQSCQEIRQISFLTAEEFARVPKHARASFTLAELDKLVVAFNDALDAKYSLLALPESHLGKAQLKKVANYRQQEMAETEGLRFLTDDDLVTRGSAFESRCMVSSFALIMRYCKRLRELRCPQRVVRYVLV